MSTSRADQAALLFFERDYWFEVSLFAADTTIEDAATRQHRDTFARQKAARAEEQLRKLAQQDLPAVLAGYAAYHRGHAVETGGHESHAA